MDKAEIKEAILKDISEGIPLREICRRDGMPSWKTVYNWINKDSEFATAMDAARNIGYDAIAEECIRIADTPEFVEETEFDGEGVVVKVKRVEMTTHRRLKVWTRLQLLSKWHPTKYGDKHAVAHSGSVVSYTGKLSEEETSELLAKLREM